MNEHIVGAWEVHTPDAPFPWHVMTFTPYGTMSQSNPHEGNQDESDSAGHGVWQNLPTGDVRAKFVEIKAKRSTGAYIGKGVIIFDCTIEGDTFTGSAQAYRYNEIGQLISGPHTTTITGTRITIAN